MVTVIVGSPTSSKQFCAHKQILVRSSSFFAAALNPNSGFAEATHNVVTLPEIRPDSFAHWLQWAYSSGNDLRWDHSDGKEKSTTEDGGNEKSAGDGLFEATSDPAAVQHQRMMEYLNAPQPGRRHRQRHVDAVTQALGHDYKSGNKAKSVVGGAPGDSSSSAACPSDQASPSSATHTHASPADKERPRFFPYVRLYQVAEYLGSEACMNDIIDHVDNKSHRQNAVPGVEDVMRLWGEEDEPVKDAAMEQVYSGKGLKSLILDLYVVKKTDKLVLREDDTW